MGRIVLLSLLVTVVVVVHSELAVEDDEGEIQDDRDEGRRRKRTARSPQAVI